MGLQRLSEHQSEDGNDQTGVKEEMQVSQPAAKEELQEKIQTDQEKTDQGEKSFSTGQVFRKIV